MSNAEHSDIFKRLRNQVLSTTGCKVNDHAISMIIAAAEQMKPAESRGDVTVTRDQSGRIVAITRNDAEGKVLSVIAESEEQTDWLQIIEDNCWDLRCVDVPTGGDDYEVFWQVIGHHMAEPRERILAESLSPSEALERALNPEQDDEE